MSDSTTSQKTSSSAEIASENLILIVANRPKSFESAANFLSRRGYPCSVVADIKHAIKIVTERKPAYVFLSWNLKNAKLMQTYNMLTRTFKMLTIVYAESPDSKTAAELSSSGLPEIIQSPVSGPGMYMRIQKIVKAREEAGAVVPGASGVTTIEAKTEDLPESGTWEESGTDQKTQQKIWRFKTDASTHKGKKGDFTFKGKKPPIKDASGKWAVDEKDKGYLGFETQAPKNNIHLSDEEIEAIASRISQGKTGEEEADEYGSIMKMGSKAKENREHTIRQDMPKSNEFEFTQKGLKGNEFEAEQKAKEGKDFNLTQKTEKGTEYEIENKGPSATDFRVKSGGAIGTGTLNGTGKESVLAQSALKALEESVNGASSVNVNQIHNVSKCAVFTIKSPRFTGYLIAASSNNSELDGRVLSSLMEKIPQHLRSSGEELSDYEILHCSISDIDFKNWSEAKADFLAVADHNSEQWGLAFFPTDDIYPKTEVHIEGKMLAVAVEDVLPESAIGFDLFIYLPVNSKHFLYVKKGQYLSRAQSDRMKKGDVTRFYIRSGDLQVFRDFCIKNRINAYVTDYKQARLAS